MPTDEEKLEHIDETLRQARLRAADIKTRADALDRKIDNSPPEPIDHANEDGGVI